MSGSSYWEKETPDLTPGGGAGEVGQPSPTPTPTPKSRSTGRGTGHTPPVRGANGAPEQDVTEKEDKRAII